MKKLIFLLPIFLFSCSKDSKEDEQVTRLKESLAGTTWTYYYKNPVGDVDITTYYFHPNENKVTFHNKKTIRSINDEKVTRHSINDEKVYQYKYEYPNLYIANEYGRYLYAPYIVDVDKNEFYRKYEMPFKKGTIDNIAPYTINDVIKITPINTSDLFEKTDTYWETSSKDKYLYFVISSGENGVYRSRDTIRPYSIKYKRLEHPYIHLKTVYYKYNIDEDGKKYEVVDENIPPLSEVATLKNNDKEIEFRGETFYRLY